MSAGRASTWESAPTSIVRRRVAVWLAASTVGGAVIAVPDTGPRLFSFSELHGPSAVDLIGMVVLVAAWLPVASLLWSKRAAVRGHPRWLAGVLAVLGLVLLVLTVGMDLGAWWIVAAAILVTAQFVALRSIARSEPTRTVGETEAKSPPVNGTDASRRAD